MPEQGARTLEQLRASKAWAHVNAVPNELSQNYRSLVRKAPAMIKMNGLGQTLAFLLAQEKKTAEEIRKKSVEDLGADGLLYKHLEEWLIEDEGDANPSVTNKEIRKMKANILWGATSKKTLIERILAEDSVVYQLAAEEALAYLGWLKRFAEARFGGEAAEG